MMATQPDLRPTDNMNYSIEENEQKSFPIWKKLLTAFGAVCAGWYGLYIEILK